MLQGFKYLMYNMPCLLHYVQNIFTKNHHCPAHDLANAHVSQYLGKSVCWVAIVLGWSKRNHCIPFTASVSVSWHCACCIHISLTEIIRPLTASKAEYINYDIDALYWYMFSSVVDKEAAPHHKPLQTHHRWIISVKWHPHRKQSEISPNWD